MSAPDPGVEAELVATAEPTADAHGGGPPSPTAPVRPSGWAAAGWIVLIGIGGALDGPVGAMAFVAVAAVLLAGLPTRLLGAFGVLLLGLAPVAFIIEGIPSSSEISPAVVTRSLLPHHLTFAGLVLVSACALLEMGPHLRAWAEAERSPQDDGPPLGTVLGFVVVGIVAVGLVLASVAVLGA